MYFRDIIGQDELKRQLIRSAHEGTVPHARLFCGKAGTGAFPLALAFARYLNCTGRSETDACGRCPSCLKYNGLIHPDLYFIFPIVAVKERKKLLCDDYLPEWRSFLATHTYFDLNLWLSHMDAQNKQALIYAKESDHIFHKVSLRIYEAACRVLLIWMPERMHPACANKLLKVIEEPPQNTFIFMVSEEPDRILGTVLSRAQRLNVGPIAPEALAKTLEAPPYTLPPEEARQQARLSHGDYLRMKENIHAGEENEFFLQQFIRIMRNSWARNVKEMKTFAEDMAGIGRERQKNFLAYCQRLIRENFAYRFEAGEMNYMTPAEQAFATRFAAYVNERNVFGFVRELSEAERHIAQNGHAKMIFFDLALQITVLLKK
ncbi:MAG: DNA polymerase III subunit delta [Tannerella sp.]|jgi:DNA polymerase-3 subunit delta'|nr:DNA polymerase III subunit delta [Tannerella sp.]